MEQTDRERVRALVRTRYDFQDMRIRMANRLKKRKDGTAQDESDAAELSEDAMPALKSAWEGAQKIEKELEKAILAELKDIPIWEQFLKGVKGIGPCIAGVIISEYDIYRATTVSKLWQFTGLNSGMVKGMKREDKMIDGKRIPQFTRVEELVRGDRRVAGFVSPFNGWLRAKMCGVLASSFIKSQAPYAMDHYYPYKERLAQSENITEERAGNGKIKQLAWKDVRPGHRDKAAKRYMIKMFLRDLYVAWRTLENLPVRVPYAEEYLGKKHEE